MRSLGRQRAWTTVMRAAAVSVLTMTLAACASGTDSSSASRNGTTIAGLELESELEALRRNPDSRGTVVAECSDPSRREDVSFHFELVFAGLLNVAEGDAMPAFCEALVEGVITGEITHSDLKPFQQPRGNSGLEPLGILLRKVLIVHQRLALPQA